MINASNAIYGFWNLTNTYGNLSTTNLFGLINKTNTFGNDNLTNVFGLLNYTNLGSTGGTITITTNASALLSAVSVTGNDTDFILSYTTSAGTQAANSNYFTLTFSSAAPNSLIPTMAQCNTNGATAAIYDRYTFYPTANTIKCYTKSSAPAANTVYNFCVHVGRY